MQYYGNISVSLIKILLGVYIINKLTNVLLIYSKSFRFNVTYLIKVKMQLRLLQILWLTKTKSIANTSITIESVFLIYIANSLEKR